MPDQKKWNPYAAAAEALLPKAPTKDSKVVKSSEPEPADSRSEAAEEKELTASAQRLRDYREKKKLASATPAEIRLYNLQMKRLKSYKHGTKKVSRTGIAKLHKGEAVLTAKQATKYRSRKIKAAASTLGAGNPKKKSR